MERRRWVTSDTHFGDPGAIAAFRRPFSSVREMDDAMIDAINRVASRSDELLHLGDFFGALDWSSKGARRDAETLLARIRCRRIAIVLGNKDPGRGSFRSMFDRADQLRSIKVGVGDSRVRVVCCHYPLRQWQGIHDGSVHLHGHSHGSLLPHGRSMDVGVDANSFAPVELRAAVSSLLASPAQPPL